MRFSETHSSINKKRIIYPAGILRNRKTGCVSQLVIRSNNKIFKGIALIQANMPSPGLLGGSFRVAKVNQVLLSSAKSRINILFWGARRPGDIFCGNDTANLDRKSTRLNSSH